MATNKKKLNSVYVPKNALSRVHVGHSFAEYDVIRDEPSLFVVTPAIQAAIGSERRKCFFVGRRGTGKTAISFYLEKKSRSHIRIVPEIVSPMFMDEKILELAKTNRRVFSSLIAAFEYAICGTILSSWIEQGLIDDYELSNTVSRELQNREFDFDDGLLLFFDQLLKAISDGNERNWRKILKRKKELYSFLESKYENERQEFTIMIDSVDDTWDGSDVAVVFLRALMHACVELNANSRFARPLLFCVRTCLIEYEIRKPSFPEWKPGWYLWNGAIPVC